MADPVDYDRQIRPIFAAHCFRCHGPKEEEGGLRLDLRNRALEGGVSGPALAQGKPAESLIYQFVTGRNEDQIVMPPKGRGQRLSDAQCELIRRWITEGAPWGTADAAMSPARRAPAVEAPAPAVARTQEAVVRCPAGGSRWARRVGPLCRAARSD
ncbi:MAG TPA: c-type cytochrome domain-containing protein [Pirellulales bacterium]|jgi:mono/diheme cytochrome c family protein|nr:c-type cytochrome domain-containing protein [Pirellulales bacterium]